MTLAEAVKQLLTTPVSHSIEGDRKGSALVDRASLLQLAKVLEDEQAPQLETPAVRALAQLIPVKITEPWCEACKMPHAPFESKT